MSTRASRWQVATPTIINFAVALEPPAKKVKKSQCNTIVTGKEVAAPHKREAMVPHKRNKKIIESDSDDNDNTFLVSSKKSLKANPLDFN